MQARPIGETVSTHANGSCEEGGDASTPLWAFPAFSPIRARRPTASYQLAEQEAERLALCVLVKTKEPQIQWCLSERNSDQLMEYLSKVGYVARQISAGSLCKRPGKWCFWCDFLPVCLRNKLKADEILVKIR